MIKHKSSRIYIKKRRKSLIKNIVFTLSAFILFIIIIGFMGYIYSSKLVLKTEKVTIANLAKDLEGFSLLHISDINGDSPQIDTEEIKRIIKGKRIDAACISGNITSKDKNLNGISKIITALKSHNPSLPIFFIKGIDDPSDISIDINSDNIYSDYIEYIETLGAKYLDKPRYIKQGKNKVWFSPEYLYSIDARASLDAMTKSVIEIENKPNKNDDDNKSLKTLSYRSRIMEAVLLADKEMDKNDIQIILNNIPINDEYISNILSIDAYRDAGEFSLPKVDLILSGHYCSGMWCLPNGTALYIPDLGFFQNKKLINGMQRLPTNNQYINAGIGNSNNYPFPAIRIFNPSTMCLIKFTSSY